MHWITAWDWDYRIITLLLLAAIIYSLCWWRVRRLDKKIASKGRLLCWLGALLTVTIATMSDIDILTNSYFSIHMFQHIMFIDITPPLILLSRPISIFYFASRGYTDNIPEAGPGAGNWLVKIPGYLLKPPVAWTISTAILCFWHIPFAYDFALKHEIVHQLGEHLTLVLAFLLWWHPLIGSLPQYSYLSRSHHRFYYLLACILTTRSLGAVILFWPSVLYTYYLTVPRIGAISYMLDQQLGGLIMLLGGMTVLLIMAIPLQYRSEFPLAWP